jgi:excisionase family DNA binding protein
MQVQILAKGEFVMKGDTTLALFSERDSTLKLEKPKVTCTPRLAQRETSRRDSGKSRHLPSRSADCIALTHSSNANRIASQDRLLTVGEFAEPVRVTRACVRRWILERKVGVVKVGRLVRIPSSEVRRIVAEGSRPAVQRT